jgi:hypothetical protein
MDIINHSAKARPTIYWCAGIGAGIALLLSPIHCVSWPILMAIEIYMLINILKIYGHQPSAKMYLTIFGILLGISAVLSLVIGDIVHILTAMLLAPIVKPIVAALVIWGLGEGTIYYLDRYVE